MRATTLVLFLSLSLTAQASWFGGDASSSSSSASAQASAWSAEQYAKAQQVFHGLKADAFDAWDESKLREFLLEQGVVEPKGTREQLALFAKQKYHSYTSAASDYSASATSLASDVSASATSLASQASVGATSLASQASAGASTAVYGDFGSQASKSISSTYAQATNDMSRKLEDSKDYVYSTWDDNSLRSYLESKGVIKTKQQVTRDDMLAKMKDTYAKAANPLWQAWSDSYMREWLVSHGILRSDAQKTRDELAESMNTYYYDSKETVYSTWTDSQMKQWLVDHDIIKSNAQLEREKLQKLIADNYSNAKDTLWSSWRDSDMREWLIDNGYLRSDAQKTRDELVALMNDKYNDTASRVAPYLIWPDARLRAYLREHNISEDALPTSRPTLLQEVRIRWVQTQHRADSLYYKIKELILSGVGTAEAKLAMILDMITGQTEHAKTRATQKYDDAKDHADATYNAASEYVDEKTAQASGKKDEYETAGKKYWNKKVEQAQKNAENVKVEL